MTTWTSDALGGIEDDVRLELGDVGALYLCESYDVKHAFFSSSPNVWAVRLGIADYPSILFEYGRPHTEIKLWVGGTLQQTGWTDGPEAEADAAGGTTVTIHGRDKMAELHDACVRADTHFKNISFADLTDAVLTKALGAGNYDLIMDGGNRQHRIASTGGAGNGAVDENTDEDIKPALIGTQGGKDLRAKFGEKWWHFMSQQLTRSGLFLITGSTGEFILCTPNTRQKPLCRILRENGKTRNQVSVLKAKYKNTSTTRYAVYEVHGRKGGSPTAGIAIPPDAPEDVKAALIGAAAKGQKRFESAFVDKEMAGWGYTKVWSHKDPLCTSPRQGLYLARRKCAEDRRANWQLQYEVSGHTTPALGSGKRVTWAIDTMVEVIDQDFGIEGVFWLESVQFKRDSSGTKTSLTLMRPEDLIFGEPAP